MTRKFMKVLSFNLSGQSLTEMPLDFIDDILQGSFIQPLQACNTFYYIACHANSTTVRSCQTSVEYIRERGGMRSVGYIRCRSVYCGFVAEPLDSKGMSNSLC